jgi:hypothetical protein
MPSVAAPPNTEDTIRSLKVGVTDSASGTNFIAHGTRD